MNWGWWAGALVALVLWVMLAFVTAVPAGWIHSFLAIGTVLVTVAIVRGDEQRREEGRGKREE